MRVETGPAFIRPDWSGAGVHAATSLRRGGVSRAPYSSFNLATHVGDDLEAVLENRRRLAAALNLPGEPCWLEQVHGTTIHRLSTHPGQVPVGDGAYTDQPGVVLAVLTADCLPVVLASQGGDEVAVVHAGWRGLAAGILEQAVACFRASPGQLRAWLGPAIGVEHYEVSREVADAFLATAPAEALAFTPTWPGHGLLDLAGTASRRLQRAGVGQVSSSGLCTYTSVRDCYSYRRDQDTGRMATLAWLG